MYSYWKTKCGLITPAAVAVKNSSFYRQTSLWPDFENEIIRAVTLNFIATTLKVIEMTSFGKYSTFKWDSLSKRI